MKTQKFLIPSIIKKIVTNCFGCKKKLGTFATNTNKKWILDEGGKPPEGMKDEDVLCNDCLENISEATKETTKPSGGFISEIPKEEKTKSPSSGSKKIVIIAVVCSVAATIGVLAMFEIVDFYTYDTYTEKQQHLLDLERDFDRIIGNYADDLGGQALVICNQSTDYVMLVSCVYKKLPPDLSDDFERDTRGIRIEYDKTIDEMNVMLQGP